MTLLVLQIAHLIERLCVVKKWIILLIIELIFGYFLVSHRDFSSNYFPLCCLIAYFISSPLQKFFLARYFIINVFHHDTLRNFQCFIIIFLSCSLFISSSCSSQFAEFLISFPLLAIPLFACEFHIRISIFGSSNINNIYL